MSRAIITLRPLTRADLAAITPWFEDADTRRSLGGPDWPAAMLDHGERAVGQMFRGAVQTAAHHYLAETNGRAVGYIDCGTFDRCTVYGGEGPDGPIILETIEAVTGSIAFVIDPAHRREGLATSMIQALTRHPDLAAVELFEAGVDPENHGSRGALEAAGFRLQSAVPDCEAMLYYRAWTSHAPAPAPMTIRSSTSMDAPTTRSSSPTSRSCSSAKASPRKSSCATFPTPTARAMNASSAHQQSASTATTSIPAPANETTTD